MMVIRMRHTRAHTGNRRSHHALRANTIVTDGETKTPHLRHRASLTTGTYRGRQVIDVAKKAIKNAKKKAN
ncbi:50S ribosomal protein L32 [Patescibacteria group bacterium]|nr:50S ribosomal protein L32 [Patescibacteria group bacterium]